MDQSNQLGSFVYTGNEADYEDLMKYTRLGLHPVTLGDVLPKPSTCVSPLAKEPRYRIMLKLGFGDFATIWLARDLVEKKYVAVKICQGTDTARRSREAEILDHIFHADQEIRGQERIIEFYDSFIIDGPNGFHECLVTEVIVPLTDRKIRKEYSVTDLMCQIGEGFTFLHEQGIVHGDPSFGSFGVALPQLDEFDEDKITKYFGNPKIIPVVPRDLAFASHSLPPYLVQAVSIADFLRSNDAFPTSDEMALTVLGFGRAHWASEENPVLRRAAPETIRPPEVLMYEQYNGQVGCVWSKAADIWAVACTIYQIRTGIELFSMPGSPGSPLYRTVQLGGLPPKNWLEIWNPQEEREQTRAYTTPLVDELVANMPHFYTSRDTAWEVHEILNKRRTSGSMSCFLSLVRAMIMTNPIKRQTMAWHLNRFVSWHQFNQEILESRRRILLRDLAILFGY